MQSSERVSKELPPVPHHVARVPANLPPGMTALLRHQWTETQWTSLSTTAWVENLFDEDDYVGARGVGGLSKEKHSKLWTFVVRNLIL